MRDNITQRLADYRGLLEWDSWGIPQHPQAYISNSTTIEGVTWPDITIELFIKQYTEPIRKPKITEVSTIPTKDHTGSYNINSQAIFFTAPDILQVTISGWMITPADWQLLDRYNNPIGNIGPMCYPELVCAFIEGRMNQGPGGSIQRRDPDKFITPHGDVYENPVIASFDWTFTPNKRKQTFNMTLWLEA